MSQSDLPPPGGTMTVTLGIDRKVKVPMWDEDAMRAYAAAAVRAEREACAKVCEEIEDQAYGLWRERAEQLHLGREAGAEQCAAAIRARGNT